MSAPMMLTQLGTMLFGVVDTLMVGRVGVAELDAAALGNVWLWGTIVVCFGIVYGLDPIIAHAHGRGDGRRAGLALQQGLIVALVISIPLMASMALTEEVLILLGQEPELAAQAEVYLGVQVWSLPPFLGFMALRQYLQGREIIAPALWVVMIANLLNVAGNELLIFGHAGLPALGLIGAGIATGITRTALFVGLALWTWRGKLYAGAWQPWSRAAFEPRGLLEVLRYGLPVGLQYLLEVWAFQLATLIAGDLGERELAAHSIVLNVASLTFMLPLGISFSASTLVGSQLGAGRRHEAQRIAWLALAFGGSVMLGCALLLVATRGVIPRLFTADAQVILIAASIFPIAGAFQVFDGLQVVGGAILRGMGDTRPAVAFNLIAYYALAMPLAFWLVYERGGGLIELWWSLVLGLAVVAGSMVVWVHRRGPARRGSSEDRRASGPTNEHPIAVEPVL
ncbi:MATE family efflux transporter [Nannocystaceae bacterium ST9]